MHKQLTECSESEKEISCHKSCQIRLPCGHPCMVNCSQPCSDVACMEIVATTVEPACGHGFINLPFYQNTPGITNNLAISGVHPFIIILLKIQCLTLNLALLPACFKKEILIIALEEYHGFGPYLNIEIVLN